MKLTIPKTLKKILLILCVLSTVVQANAKEVTYTTGTDNLKTTNGWVAGDILRIQTAEEIKYGSVFNTGDLGGLIVDAGHDGASIAASTANARYINGFNSDTDFVINSNFTFDLVTGGTGTGQFDRNFSIGDDTVTFTIADDKTFTLKGDLVGDTAGELIITGGGTFDYQHDDVSDTDQHIKAFPITISGGSTLKLSTTRNVTLNYLLQGSVITMDSSHIVLSTGLLDQTLGNNLTLTGANSITGATNLTLTGTISIANPSAGLTYLDFGSTNVDLSGITLDLSGVATGQTYNIFSSRGTVTGFGDGGASPSFTINGVVKDTMTWSYDDTTGIYSFIINREAITHTWDGSTTTITLDSDSFVSDEILKAGDSINVNFTADTQNSITIGESGVSLGGLMVDTAEGTYTISGGTLSTSSGSSTPALTKTGIGTLELTGANAFTGAVHLNEGKLIVGANGALGTGQLQIAANSTLEVAAGVHADLSAATLFERNTTNYDIVLGADSSLKENVRLNLTGGILDIRSADSVTDATTQIYTIAGLELSNSSPTVTTVNIQSNTTLKITGTRLSTRGGDGSGGFMLSEHGAANIVNVYGILDIAGGISNRDGTGTISVKDGGEFIMRRGLAAASNSAASSDITISIEDGGKLTLYTKNTTLENDDDLNGTNNPAIILPTVRLTNGSTLNAGEANLTIADSLNLTGGSADKAVQLTGVGDYSITGTLSGTGALELSSDISVTLSGANSYSGGTKVSGGTLVLGHASAAGSGSISVSGGSVNLGSASNDVILSGGEITNTAAWTGDLHVTAGTHSVTGMDGGSITVDAGATLTLGGTISIGSQNQISVTGALTLADDVIFDLSALGLSDWTKGAGTEYTFQLFDLSDGVRVTPTENQLNNMRLGDLAGETVRYNDDGTLSFTLAAYIYTPSLDEVWTTAGLGSEAIGERRVIFGDNDGITTTATITISGAVSPSNIRILSDADITFSAESGGTLNSDIVVSGSLTVGAALLSPESNITLDGGILLLADTATLDASQISTETGEVLHLGAETGSATITGQLSSSSSTLYIGGEGTLTLAGALLAGSSTTTIAAGAILRVETGSNDTSLDTLSGAGTFEFAGNDGYTYLELEGFTGTISLAEGSSGVRIDSNADSGIAGDIEANRFDLTSSSTTAISLYIRGLRNGVPNDSFVNANNGLYLRNLSGNINLNQADSQGTYPRVFVDLEMTQDNTWGGTWSTGSSTNGYFIVDGADRNDADGRTEYTFTITQGLMSSGAHDKWNRLEIQNAIVAFSGDGKWLADIAFTHADAQLRFEGNSQTLQDSASAEQQGLFLSGSSGYGLITIAAAASETITIGSTSANYSGDIVVESGTLSLTTANAFSSASTDISISGGVIKMNDLAQANSVTMSGGSLLGASNWTGNLTATTGSSTLDTMGTGTMTVNSGATLTITGNVNASAVTLDGTIRLQNGINLSSPITGAGSVHIAAAGTAASLSGASSYSGDTVLEAGATLQLRHAEAAGESTIKMAAGSELQLGNATTVTNDIEVSGATTLSLHEEAVAASSRSTPSATYSGSMSGQGDGAEMTIEDHIVFDTANIENLTINVKTQLTANNSSFRNTIVEVGAGLTLSLDNISIDTDTRFNVDATATTDFGRVRSTGITVETPTAKTSITTLEGNEHNIMVYTLTGVNTTVAGAERLDFEISLTDVEYAALIASLGEDKMVGFELKGVADAESLNMWYNDVWISILVGETRHEHQVMGYNKSAVVGQDLIVYVPEPSTATLSMLALAGLLGRRRRKQ